MEVFATLPMYINNLHPNIEDMKILYFYHILPLIAFSTANNILIPLKRSNFNLVFFRTACHANPGADIKFTGSSLCISRHIFRKFSNSSANNNVLLWTYKSRYSSNFFYFKIFTHSFCMPIIWISNIFHTELTVKIFLFR